MPISTLVLGAIHLFVFMPVYSTVCHADDKNSPYSFLDNLNDDGFVIDDKSISAGTFGVRIIDLNSAVVEPALFRAAEKVKDIEEFREALCEKLLDPQGCLEAYALLNQLYPEYILKISVDSYFCAEPREGTHVPVKILSGNELILVQVNIRSFGDICRSYWRRKLKVRSELEKTWDRTRPGWREELENAMEKERQRRNKLEKI